MSSAKNSSRGAVRHLAREQCRFGFLAEPDLWMTEAVHRKLSVLQYLVFVAGGVALTAAQVLVLPRVLGAAGFGMAVISISVTQGVQAFGDLGFGRLSDDTLRPKPDRDHLRTLSLSTALTLTLGLVMVGAPVATVTGGVLIWASLIGASTAAVLYGTQLMAQAYEAGGDELGGALRHFVWQNGPKVGLIAGALLTRSAIGCMAGGMLSAAIVSPPRLCSLRFVREVPALWRRWLPAFAVIVSPFVLTWADTYFVAAHLGLSSAAEYVVIYRILGGVTYLYLPFGSVLLSRWNRGEHRASWIIPMFSIAIIVPTLFLLGAGLRLLGPHVYPDLHLNFGLILPLALMYVLADISYLSGTSLVALGRFSDALIANVTGATVAIVGHVVFTLHSGLVTTAAWVSLTAVGITATIGTAAVVRAVRRDPRREAVPGSPAPAGP